MIDTILKVARHELLTYVRKPSFIFTTLLVPLIAVIAATVIGADDNPVTEAANSLSQQMEETAAQATNRFGVVDESGVLRVIPPPLEGVLIPFESVDEAEDALRAEELDAVYVVAPDYLESGEITRVARRFDFAAGDTALVEQALLFNLLEGGDAAQLALIQEPLPNVEFENVGTRTADQVAGQNAEGIAFLLAYVLSFLLYTTVITSSSYLLQSVTLEKESRMIEMLLTSLRPVELLAGKVLGLGLLGLGQVLLWGGTAYAIAAFGPLDLPDLDALGITWQLGVLVLIYFLIGYIISAIMMSGIGALVPSVKEAGPATFLVILPMLIPLMFLANIIEEPQSTLAVVLSIIPFTSPIAMMARLAQGGIPAWQIALSIGLGIVTIPILLQLVARLFRTQTLLTSESFSMGRLWATLRESA